MAAARKINLMSNSRRYSCVVMLLGSVSAALAVSVAMAESQSKTAAESKRITALVAALADEDVQLGASVALTKFGRSAVPKLAQALNSNDQDIRVWAAYTLGRIGADASSSVDGMTKSCGHADDTLRAASVEALGGIGVASKLVVNALTKTLTDKNETVRLRSAVALGELGSEAHPATKALLVALLDVPVRTAARNALIQVGQRQIGILRDALEDNVTRFDVAIVLRAINKKQAEELGVERPSSADLVSLERALFDPTRNAADQVLAAEALASLETDGVRVLIKAFENPKLSRTAAEAFSNSRLVAVPLLVKTLEHKNAAVRAAACSAFYAMGSKAHAAQAKLAETLDDTDRDVRYRAVRALHVLGEKAAPAIPKLLEVILKSGEQEATRQWAIKTLVITLPKTHDAVVKGLIAASQDEVNYGVRSLAERQLRQIDPEAAKKAGI